MKTKVKESIKGSISVLLVIILLPMMTFSAVIVDISRANMAKQMMSSAGDLTMNTALANYDTILKDVYGLFAMSQANGMDNEKLGEELNNYFAKTLSSYGVVPAEDSKDYVEKLIGNFTDILNGGTVDTNNFLELTNIDLQATKVEGSSLANASVMRKQIVEYMKYRAPMGVGLSFLDSLTSFKKIDAQNKVVEAQVKAQESTQDVTAACQKLIEMIRAYDKRVVEINGLLKGVTSSTDTTVIPLEDYDTHVTKYLSVWKDANYEHINKLNLIFLANTPGTDSAYLKSLAYGGGERYIKADGTLYSGSNSTGINVTVTLAGDSASAKKQIDDQITNLNNNYKGYIEKYATAILPYSALANTSNNVSNATISKTNEETVINNFIKFEKFLLDKSDDGNITYSQVKSVLEQIAILDKYRANYESKINAEITKAENDKTAAESNLASLKSTRDGAAKDMQDRITYINNKIRGYVKNFDNIDDALSFLGTDNKLAEIRAAMTELPARTVDYPQYYDTYIKSGESDIYLYYFKWLVNDSTFGDSDNEVYEEIISKAKKFVEANEWDSNGFDNYMTNTKPKLSKEAKNDPLYKLLSCLKTCHAYAITYKNNTGKYSDAVSKIPDAEQAVTDATNEVNRLKGEKTGTLNSVKLCIQDYANFGATYQSDIYYYKYYINAAKNTIGPEATKISTHFKSLYGYLKELRDDLNDIDVQIGKVKTAIEAYNTNLKSWSTANKNYTTSNGMDSFSNQTAGDIEKAKTEYDATLYDTLDTFVIAIWNEFDDLYSKLTDSTNFKYGTKRIDQITTADHLKSAISKTSFSDIVTVEEATQKLSTLYKGETIDYVPYTMDYTKQLGFLSPVVVQIQALKYLNSAYPEAIAKTCDDCGTCDYCKANATKNDYEKTKNQLTGSDKTMSSTSGGSKNPEVTEEISDKVTSNFGYTFSNKKVLESLPSSLTQTSKKEFLDSEHKITKSGSGDSTKLNASSSVSEQSKKSGSVLTGIGNIVTTAVENLYVLNYVFENFSYNTIVQDQIVKDSELTNKTSIGQIAEVQTMMADAKVVSAAKEATTTLSNYKINEKNNYMYGGEIEYILFGNADASKNVTSAKASIYAIRFAFNCIFAFTNPEIRNSTMAAGIAVQTATMGIVPYQIVQIVLQLALAAAESAIDLSVMNHGLTVAIVKTKDTWSLSMSGAANALKDAGNAAAQMAADKISGVVTKGIDSIANGLNDLVDATADELSGAIADLESNMTTAAEGVLESVADKVLTDIITEIEAGLNELQYVKVGDKTAGEIVDSLPTKADVRAQAVSLFSTIKGKVPTIISEACGDNAMAQGIASILQTQANSLITSMETKVLDAIDSVGDGVDVTEFIATQLNELKLQLVECGSLFITNISANLTQAANGAVSQTKETLNKYIEQCKDDLSEEAANLIKEEVKSFADGFVDTTLKVNGTSTSTDVKSSVISMFKFGYKDYLMLLTYISICTGDSVLVRTADTIQMNVQSAGEGADYQHKANTESAKFQMSKAYTYVSISATADLDMFFMDLDIFLDQVTDETDDPNGETDETGSTISYRGLLGY